MAAAIAESKKIDKTSRERAELEKIQVLSFSLSPLPSHVPHLLSSFPVTPIQPRIERETRLPLREILVYL